MLLNLMGSKVTRFMLTDEGARICIGMSRLKNVYFQKNRQSYFSIFYDVNHFLALRHQIKHNLSWKGTRKKCQWFSEISSCADGGLSLGEKNCQFRRIYYPPEISIDGRKGGSPNISFFMNLIIFATWAALNRTLGPTFSL